MEDCHNPVISLTMMAIGLWYESLRFKTLMFLDTKVKTGGIIECHHLCKTSYGMLELGCAPGQELAFVTELWIYHLPNKIKINWVLVQLLFFANQGVLFNNLNTY